MDTSGLKWPTPFVYQTDGGFTVESDTAVQGFFSPEDQAISWFDFQTGVVEFNFLRQPFPAISAFDFEPLTVRTPVDSYFDEQIVIPQLPIFEVLNLQAIADQMSDFVGSVAVIRTCIVDALRYYCKRLSKIVGHEVILLAGRPFLIPQSTQEAINALVRDDIDHFQTIALAREHSPLNTIHVVQRLKEICRERWSKWLSRSRYSKISSNWFAEYAISADLSVSFVLG
jgi:hypothetical protein